MGLRTVSVSELRRADWNYRSADEETLGKLVENMRRTGQVENIIVRQVDGGLEVVNGNHRLEALERLGWKEATAWDLGRVSDAEAMRVAVETNELRFDVDQVRLAEIVADLGEEWSLEELEPSMPFSRRELEDYASLLEFDWSQYSSDPDVGSSATSISLEAGTYERLRRAASWAGERPGEVLRLISGAQA